MTTRLDVWKLKARYLVSDIGHLKFKTEFAIKEAISNLEYRIKAKTDYKTTKENNERFASEFIGYLKQSMPSRLERISPSKREFAFLNRLIDYADKEKLVQKETRRLIWYDSPVLLSSCEAGESYKEQRKEMSSENDLASYISAFVHNTFLPFTSEGQILYNSIRDATSDIPLSVRIRQLDFPKTSAFEFVFTEKKPENSKELADMLPAYIHKHNTLSVYETGNRFLMNFKKEESGRKYESTHQFFHIGVLKSEVEQKEFHVYGSNENKHYTSSVESWI